MKTSSRSFSPRAAFTCSAFRALLTIGLGVSGVAAGSRAADITWNNPGADLFSNPNDWSTGTVPGTGDQAIIANGGTPTIQNGDAFTVNYLTLTSGGLTQSGGSLISSNTGTPIRIGSNTVNSATPTTATFTQTAGTLTSAQRLYFADGMTSTSNVVTATAAIGGTVSAADYIVIGRQGGTATVGVTGTLQKTTNINRIIIGDGAFGNGTLNVSGNGVVTTTTGFDIANGNGSTGVVTLTNNASLTTSSNGVNNALVVGGGNGGGTGNGTLNVRDSASVNTTAAELWIGNGTGSVGTLNQSGGTLTVGNWLAVGRLAGGSGTLNLSGGTINKTGTNASHLTLGSGANATGTINQTGGSLQSLAGTGTMFLGESGTGNYNMSGGTATIADGVVFGSASGGTGTLTLQAATGGVGGDEVFTTSTITMGNAGAGAATVLLNGGTLSTAGFLPGAGTGPKVIDFNGGTLQATAASTAFLGGAAVTAYVDAGGARIDTNGNAVTIATPLTSLTAPGADGGLTKLGAGTLTLSGANSYLGTTTVSAGALAVNGSIGSASSPAGAVTVATAGTLSGIGMLAVGASNVVINGTLAPGATPTAGDLGTLTISTAGALTLTGTAVTQFDLATTGNDLITAAGARLTLGGILALNLGTGVTTGTFALFNGLAAVPTGTFSSVTGVPANEQATFSYAGGTYSLSLAAVPEPSTWALGAFGMAGMAAVWVRRRLRAQLAA